MTRVLKLAGVQTLIAELRQHPQDQAVKTLLERSDAGAEEAAEHLIALMRGAKSETVQFKAAESILDRSAVAPKRQIHSTPAEQGGSRVIRIVFDRDTLEQIHQAYEGFEPIDVSPTPAALLPNPVDELLAKVKPADEWDR